MRGWYEGTRWSRVACRLNTRKYSPRSAVKLKFKNWGWGDDKIFPLNSHIVFTECESPITGEENRLSSTNERSRREVVKPAGDRICPEKAIPRVADSCSKLDHAFFTEERNKIDGVVLPHISSLCVCFHQITDRAPTS